MGRLISLESEETSGPSVLQTIIERSSRENIL